MIGRRLFHRRECEEQLDKELRFHLDRQIADLIDQGIEPAEARRRARLAFGGDDRIREECRDARGARWLEDAARDARHALRGWLRQPGFAAVALLTLGLGIGAATVTFTVVHGVLLRPLAFSHPERLVSIEERTSYSTALGNLWAVAFPNYRDIASQSRTLTAAAWSYEGGIVSEPGDADYVDGDEITAGLLSLLGVAPIQGRNFQPADDNVGAAPAAIIGYDQWQRHFAGSPAALGSRIVFDGRPYTVIGVMPRGFDLAGYASTGETGIYTLFGQDVSPALRDRRAHVAGVTARVRRGATLASARAELATIASRLAAQYPASNRDRDFQLEPLRPDVGDAGAALWLLLGAAMLVLLIGCANIAGLLLARAVARDHEMAMRVALGAGRGRLVRQCLAESSVLALAGGALGVGLAAAGLRPFLAIWPGGLPRAGGVRLDGDVLLFSLAISLLCGVAFGLAPAWRVPMTDVEQRLRRGARGERQGSRRVQAGLVAAETALAMVLLVSAGLLGRSLLRLSSVDLGVDPRNVLTGRVALSPAVMNDPARMRAAWDTVLSRVRQTPGVRAAAIVDTIPLREGNNRIGYWTSPVEPPVDQKPNCLANSVSADYFQVMGIRLLRGRTIDERDRIGSLPVAVIDDVLARHAFGRQDPIGRHIWLGLGNDPLTIVGVVNHVRYWGAGDDRAAVRDQVYYAFAQVPDTLVRRWSELMSIGVRTSVPALDAVDTVRRAVRGPGGDEAFYEIRTLDALAADALAQQRFLLLLFAVFSGVALLLACIGVYGVLAHLTGQRIPEIGVRMALGASARSIIWLVVRQTLAMVGAGAVAGVVVAVGAGELLRRFVAGVGDNDPATFVLMTGLLAAAALIASYPCVRRAVRIDPMRTLRRE